MIEQMRNVFILLEARISLEEEHTDMKWGQEARKNRVRTDWNRCNFMVSKARVHMCICVLITRAYLHAFMCAYTHIYVYVYVYIHSCIS